MLYFNPFEESQKAERERNLQARAASKRLLYGKFNGHWQWDLAVNWFQMTNDGFFNLYGFNFVPRGRLYSDAKDFVHSR
ncbi:hypothetical protein [Sporosarcina sp. FSL K6-3457]|uniref:hypothetical protein n=1 Tax=Sporosarcina sp. FSL K6-3457 TaxID=2978204 RepID=UPI0030FA3E48